MKPPRFSLRGLLLATLIAAAFCYWRDRPRQRADALVAAVDAGDYRRADALCDGDPFSSHVGGAGEFWVRRAEQSPRDWLYGQCRVSIVGKGSAIGVEGTAVVTATNVRVSLVRHNYGGVAPFIEQTPLFGPPQR